MLESIAIFISLAYNYHLKNPFSTYGEGVFLVAQNFIIIALILSMKHRYLHLMILGALNSFFAYALYHQTFISMPLLSQLQVASIFIGIASRIPQIWSNFSNGNTGQLSIISTFLQFAGSLARVFTSYQYLFAD